MTGKETREKRSAGNKALTIIGAVFCIILFPILVINCTMIVKSYTQPDKVPSVGGTMPLIVLTDSMYPEIESGDLIICHTIDAEAVREGDVIAFFDPAGSGQTIVTHRVIEIIGSGSELSFRTKGDANNAADQEPVSGDKLVGLYRMRIAGAGRVALFMQTTPGLLICVLVPLAALIGIDMLRRRKYETARKEDTDALLAELEALRAAQDKESAEK